ncbi:Uncharacterised protein [Mycobacteroides abscessus subsp. abscessus]|nr:Uncharacterised protein [Mycobacteroides abscessus subsp. abscessus]
MHFDKARKLIISEWDRLTESKNYLLLSNEAQEFIKIIKEEKENGSFELLTDSDKKILNLINKYIVDFQLHLAKRLYSEHQALVKNQKQEDGFQKMQITC